ncbi:hypothetical protein [Streptomyces fradiae]|uniref:hypothetical protein n=1 Tax=Streptomyces fradiae TaxID=1906 RepID=UPI0039887672
MLEVTSTKERRLVDAEEDDQPAAGGDLANFVHRQLPVQSVHRRGYSQLQQSKMEKARQAIRDGRGVLCVGRIGLSGRWQSGN